MALRLRPVLRKPIKGLYAPNMAPANQYIGRSPFLNGQASIPNFFSGWENSPALAQLGYRGMGGGGGGGGGNPYSGILSDYTNQMRADNAAASNADRGSMINSIRQYIISYGQLPDFQQLGGLTGDAKGYFNEALDQQTKDLAAKAEAEGVSSHARLAHDNAIATRRIPAVLAGRGLLHSGQTGSDLAEQAQTYKNQGYDMLNALLQGITGNVSGFQQAERERQRALADAEMQAAMNAAGDWGSADMGGGYDYGYGTNPSIAATVASHAPPKPKPKPKPYIGYRPPGGDIRGLVGGGGRF